FGLSAALLEELTVKGGAIQQTNFDNYPVLRMSDLPEIHTKIVTTDNPPSGMGEIGVVAVAPAIANALFQLTGKRIRNLPMSPGRVKLALASLRPRRRKTVLVYSHSYAGRPPVADKK